MSGNLSNDYISVIVTSYNRPHYLKRCIESLHQYADMPFELIVHDDGSNEETRSLLSSMKDDISLCILNNGKNSGLSRSINRCIEMASSSTTLFLCDDCWVVEPCFRNIYNVLQRPYVGWVCPGDNRLLDYGQARYNLKFGNVPVANSSGTRYVLTNNLMGAFTLGFRTDVWSEVGGWEERCSTGRSDNVFISKLIQAGYWKAALEGTPKIEIANLDNDYIPCGNMMQGDNNPPLLFNTHEAIFNTIKDDVFCLPGGLADINYWFSYMFELFSTNFDSIFEMKDVTHDANKINWIVGQRHNQSKWQKEIQNDFR